MLFLNKWMCILNLIKINENIYIWMLHRSAILFGLHFALVKKEPIVHISFWIFMEVIVKNYRHETIQFWIEIVRRVSLSRSKLTLRPYFPFHRHISPIFVIYSLHSNYTLLPKSNPLNDSRKFFCEISFLWLRNYL